CSLLRVVGGSCTAACPAQETIDSAIPRTRATTGCDRRQEAPMPCSGAAITSLRKQPAGKHHRRARRHLDRVLEEAAIQQVVLRAAAPRIDIDVDLRFPGNRVET